jgi:hypothetical protein
MYLGREMFEPVADRDLARRLFQASVARVEVETHSYCNRRCSYCPNVVGDRLGANQRMDEDLYLLIVEELAEIGYRGEFVLNSYNEPLYDRIILERIAQARARLPEARIMIFTNGDYLSPGYLEELAAAGLSFLHISIHLKQGDSYSDVYVLNRLSEISRRIGIAARFTEHCPDQYLVAMFPHPGMEIMTRAINFWRHGKDRGGLIKAMARPAVRTDPCGSPFAHFVVGYAGNVVPCCQIRSDNAEHEPYRIGNLRGFGSIFRAFTSPAAVAWRRALVHDGAKAGPCETCSAPLRPDTEEARRIFRRAHRRCALGEASAGVG